MATKAGSSVSKGGGNSRNNPTGSGSPSKARGRNGTAAGSSAKKGRVSSNGSARRFAAKMANPKTPSGSGAGSATC